MAVGAVAGIAVGSAVVGLAAGYLLFARVLGKRGGRAEAGPAVRRILLPFTGTYIPRRAFEAAVRLAKAENAVIMPAFLARVPMNLPLDAPLPKQSAEGMPLLEVIEQRALAQGVKVDSRVARGRTARDALRKLLEQESFDRIIVSAGHGREQPSGMSDDDIRWLLEKVPAEVMVLRPAHEDRRRIATQATGMRAL